MGLFASHEVAGIDAARLWLKKVWMARHKSLLPQDAKHVPSDKQT